ncbi:addiction module protein [Candidatus Sumerlaeota bacterium]|nr:addiction module protein [Candidatus Sumerlaeota bacterium]
MSTKLDQIIAESLALPPQARAYVAEKLNESLEAAQDADLTPAWREEIQRR